MHTITRVLLTCVLAVAALPGLILAAPLFQTSVEPRGLALMAADLASGFAAVPDRTVSEERPDGVAVYDVTFVRERTPANLAEGAYEVRSGVARTARAEDAIQQLASTKEAFAAEGWQTVAIPPLGDESAGLTQITEGDGGPTASYSYLFRKGQWILMIGLRGAPDATKMEDAVALAIVVSQRVDRALGAGQPDGTPGGASATRTRAPLTERVRVISPGGANVRSEPSTSATVVAEAPEGMIVEVAGPNRDADGRTWRNVRMSDGQTGWIASTLVESIMPTPGPAASPTPAPASSPAPRAAASPSSAGPASAATESGTSESGTEGDTAGAAGEPGADDPGADDPGADDPGADEPEAADDTGAPAETGAADETGSADEGEASAADPGTSSAQTTAAATSTPQSMPQSTPASAGTTARATGPGGLAVEATLREATLSSGSQQARVLVTRDGQPVPDARIDVTARLDANRYLSVNAPRTGSDGRSEIEWPMEGPAGDYQVVVEVRPDDTAPPTTATAKFRWK